MKNLTWIIGAVVILLAIGGVFLVVDHKKGVAPPTSTSGNATVGATGISAIITYSDRGFSPSPLTISPGTTVTWSNTSSHSLLVQGDSIHEPNAIAQGGSYSVTFTTPGTISYHNQEASSDTGTIVVTNTDSETKFNASAQPE